MNKLRMLGGIDLAGADEATVDAVLRQPKLIALLAYLSMPRPGTWHRRDALLAAFWPNADQSRTEPMRTVARSCPLFREKLVLVV
jgi:DNA-binding SARP family transcriptional activator